MHSFAQCGGSLATCHSSRRPACVVQYRRPAHLTATCRASLTLAPPSVPASIAHKPRLVYAGAGAADGMCQEKSSWWESSWDAHLTPPSISKPDDHFEKMGLEFVHSRDGIVLTELNDLFEKVGFPRRDPEKLRVALENTHAIIWVRSTKQSRLAKMGQLLAFSRATGDGVLSATIWDVAVLPAWQRCGLGRALMERLTAKLVADSIPTITLYAEPNVVSLYEKLGFTKDPDGIRGMAFQRRKLKNGQRQPALMR